MSTERVVQIERRAVPYRRLSAWYLFYFAIVGTISPYWALYLSQLGFSAYEIGWLTAALFITKVFAPNLWAWVGIRIGLLSAARLGALLALIALTPLLFSSSFAVLMATALAFSFFWNAILAQWESITIGCLDTQPHTYGYIRLWGSVGFALAVVGLGWLFEQVTILWMPAAIAVFLFANFVISIAVAAPTKRRSDQPIRSSKQLTSGLSMGVALFMLAQTLLQISHGAYYTFYSVYLSDYQYSSASIGLLWALAVLVEMAMFIAMVRWQRHFSLYSILQICLLITIVRWLLTAFFIQYSTMAIFAQLLHAFSFAAMHAASIEVIRRHFNGHNQGHGQALYSAFGFGLGGALGALLAGFAWTYSANLTFVISAVAAMAALLLIAAAGKQVTDPKVNY